MPWYAVHTNARAEWMVHKRLREQGYDTLYLHRRETVSHARRKIAVLRPLYARYLFVSIEPGQSHYAVNTTPGVSTILRGPSGPMEISEAAMAAERAKGDETGLVAPPKPIVRAPLNPGTPLWIRHGAFEGFPGTVSLDKGCEIELDVVIFGRSTRAVVPFDWVSVVSPEVRSAPRIPVSAPRRAKS